MSPSFITASLLIAHFILQLGFIFRALLRSHREPSSRVAWVLVILALPAIGMTAYVLFGETNIGSKRIARYRKASKLLDPGEDDTDEVRKKIKAVEPEYFHLFLLGHSISGFLPAASNAAELLPGSNEMIDALVKDIDAAQRHVHVLFYIWLSDGNGLKVVDALKRAATRGVVVRAMADDLGSRQLIRSPHWKELENAGVKLARALPVQNVFFHPIRGRVDLRNHRKIVVIDTSITYCGSQNCADPEFSPKPKYAPWVDLVVRFEGPIAAQNQKLFLQDWLSHVDDPLDDLKKESDPGSGTGDVVAQVVGTGPTVRNSAMPEMFEALMHQAREELIITTPYFVPSEAMQSALCSAAFRGVRTILVLPARNDSWVVAAASRSYYSDLLEAGVRIYEYPLGLLHAKSLTVDNDIALIGSANLDRRSFDLNYENNILVRSSPLTHALRERQHEFIRSSVEIGISDVNGWSVGRRLWNNSVAMLGPVL